MAYLVCNASSVSMKIASSGRLSELLYLDQDGCLLAYSLFYNVLRDILPGMTRTSVALDRRVQTAVKYVTENWDRDFSICDLAKACCVSESTLYHLFRSELGQTPIHLVHSIRINVAMEYLETTDYSVATISRMVCFPSENHFRKVFRTFTGTTPLTFRKKQLI